MFFKTKCAQSSAQNSSSHPWGVPNYLKLIQKILSFGWVIWLWLLPLSRGLYGGGQAVTGGSSQPIRTIYHPGVPVTVIKEKLIFASGRLVFSKHHQSVWCNVVAESDVDCGRFKNKSRVGQGRQAGFTCYLSLWCVSKLKTIVFVKLSVKLNYQFLQYWRVANCRDSKWLQRTLQAQMTCQTRWTSGI